MGNKSGVPREGGGAEEDEHIAKIPSFVKLPHNDAGTWGELKQILQRQVADGAQLDELISAVVRLRNPSVPDFSNQFFNTFEFPAIHNNASDGEAVPSPSEYFFTRTLPFMQTLALQVETLFVDELRVFRLNEEASATFSRRQLACLLAHSFFCSYDRGSYDRRSLREYFQDPNFLRLYEYNLAEMVKFIVHYFNRIAAAPDLDEGFVTYSRKVLPEGIRPDWAKTTLPLGGLEMHKDGTIEDSPAILHADFANRYIGGGVLHGGRVQEEILFVLKPECIVSMIFCPRMTDREVILIHGAERFSRYSGYNLSLKYAGNYVNTLKRDAKGRLENIIVAMDATKAFATGGWHLESVTRDLNKAYIGFYVHDEEREGHAEFAVATGHWGCGAFGGDPQLKFVQQLLATSLTGRMMHYYTFDKKQFADAAVRLYDRLVANNVTVGRLFDLMLEFSHKHEMRKIANEQVVEQSFFDFLNSKLD